MSLLGRTPGWARGVKFLVYGHINILIKLRTEVLRDHTWKNGVEINIKLIYYLINFIVLIISCSIAKRICSAIIC